MKNLKKEAILGLVRFTIALGLFIFLPVWSIAFWQGWLYIFSFCFSSTLITYYLWKNDKALLARRLKVGPKAEKEKKQKIIQLLAAIAFMMVMIFPSIDQRFGWSHLPLAVILIGNFGVMFGFFITFLTFKENTYTAGVIEIAKDQRVISTGLYAYVRHPMYAGALLILISTPLAMDSWWGLFFIIPIIALIIWRLLDEERFLHKNLLGYTEYCRKVRFRLLPFIW